MRKKEWRNLTKKIKNLKSQNRYKQFVKSYSSAFKKNKLLKNFDEIENNKKLY